MYSGVLRWSAVLTFCACAAAAEPVEVPHLADGSVDVAAVMTSFHARIPVYSDGKNGPITGEFLGGSFKAFITRKGRASEFDLRLEAPGFSREAVYLAALMLSEFKCMRNKQRFKSIAWPETVKRVGDSWTVSAYCKDKTG